MQITWKGQSCFFITFTRGRQEQVRVVIDPYGESVGLRLTPAEADLVLVTHEHEDHNNLKAIKGTPFVASSPGEYEVQGVVLQGISSFHDNAEGKERGLNTIFTLEEEGMRLCHLGDLGQTELSSEQVEQIGQVDVLFVPVGGTFTIDAKEAAHIVGQIEPRLVIPMHYAVPHLKVKLEGVERFLKVMGVRETEPQQKLLLKKKDLPAEGTHVVVLQL
ncbi:MAG: MBL fold metallo-hydrolase [Patescibacteria group bacterium]